MLQHKTLHTLHLFHHRIISDAYVYCISSHACSSVVIWGILKYSVFIVNNLLSLSGQPTLQSWLLTNFLSYSVCHSDEVPGSFLCILWWAIMFTVIFFILVSSCYHFHLFYLLSQFFFSSCVHYLSLFPLPP